MNAMKHPKTPGINERNKRLLISLTNACPYRCVFCVYLHDRQPADLPAEAWLDILKEAKRHGFGFLEIGSQGEPALHPDFEKIIASAYRWGYAVEVLTNLQEGKRIKKILPYLNLLTINLNATDAGEFRDIHGIKKRDAFKNALDSLKDILDLAHRKKYAVRFKINYVITKNTAAKAISFVRKFHRILLERMGRPADLSIHFHHMLLTPHNHFLAPDKEQLRRLINEFRIAARLPFFVRTTNVLDFTKKTQQILNARTLMGPLHRNTMPNDTNSKVVKRLNGLMTCEAWKNNLFIDCNGDIFGCLNPTRILFGLPAADDPTFYGNVKDGRLAQILKTPPQPAMDMDFANRFWKACVICGLKKRTQP